MIVEIYSKDNCVFCDRAKRLFNSKDIPYTEIHAPDHRDALIERVVTATGKPPKTVPQIFIDEQYIGGFDDLVKWMDAQDAGRGRMNSDLLNSRSDDIFARNVKAGWWSNISTKESTIKTRNRPEVMMLIVSELSEASEGYNGALKDDKLPHRDMAEVEIADALIRIHDLLGAEGVIFNEDLGITALSFNELSFDEALMVLVNHVSSAMEGYRKTNLRRYHESLLRAAAAGYAMGASFGYDIEGAITEKLAFNATREDHQISSRMAEGGKKF